MLTPAVFHARKQIHRSDRILLAVALVAIVLESAGAQTVAGDSPATAQAAAIFRETGTCGGLVVHVNCGNGRLTGALRQNERFLVQGLDTDATRVAQARRHLQGQGIYGPVSVNTFDGSHLPYADGLVNLIVAEDPGRVSQAECMRVLCPGGVAYIQRNGTWQKTVKPWPPQIDQWTHWLHGPDGNPVAADQQVGPPRYLQWISRPFWLRHHNRTISFSAMVSAKGRVFYIVDDSPSGVVGLPDQWKLVARDAFNGVLLWERPVSDWGWSAWTPAGTPMSQSRFDQPPDLPRRLVAVGDRVFVALGEQSPLMALDAATGETLQTYTGTQRVSEVLYQDGLLIVSVHRPSERSSATVSKRGTPLPLWDEHILAFDANSGAQRWQRTGFVGVASKTGPLRPFTQLFLACDSRQLYLVDRQSICSLDLSTGKELWRAVRPAGEELAASYSSVRTTELCTLIAHDEVLLYAQEDAYKKNPWYEPLTTTVLALSKTDGKEVWRFDAGSWSCYAPPNLFVIDDLVWCQSRSKPYELLGLDLNSGKIRRRFSINRAMVTEHHHRCYRDKATSRYVLTSRRGIELLDLQKGDNLLNHWTRGACRYGIMPCNGLIYAPPDPCICYITAKVTGMVAMRAQRNVEADRPISERLEAGPAFARFAERAGTAAGEADRKDNGQWPTFRHDAQRTGSTGAAISEQLQPGWKSHIGGNLSAPVVAGGRVLVAAIDQHTVHALDSSTGKRLWTFTASGRVDSPPTLYGGLALFGSADGYVYALSSDDGRLAWRFQAAPRTMSIGAFGQLESAWPVHGSVLVHNGVAYVTAGRSSFLDGGIWVYALDPRTGKVLHHRVFAGPGPEDTRAFDQRLRYDMPPDRPGALSDILVADRGLIALRHIHIDPRDFQRDLEKEKKPEVIQDVYRKQIPRVYSPGPQVASSAGMLDESWFNQTYWSVDNASHCRLLVCDSQHAYGIRAYGGKPARHSRAKFIAGRSKYTLFADRRRPEPKRIWSVATPVRVGALLVAKDRLFAAGPGTNAPPEDPWQTIEGRGTGQLIVHATGDGKQLAHYNLAAAPVWNGMAAADGRLFLALRNGSVVCLESPGQQ